MTQHVRVHVLQSRALPDRRDEIVKPLARERRAALADEQPRQAIGARVHVGLQRAQCIAGNRLIS